MLLILVLLLTLSIALYKRGILYLGPLYIAIRNNGISKIPFISKGVLRQLGKPWRRGVGIELRARQYVLHIGVCRKTTSDDPTLSSLDGSWMDVDIETIKGWN